MTETRMVDITAKADTERVAVAKGMVVMKPETLALIQQGEMAKGDVLSVAQTAGIMAAKRTAELIPLCHPLLLTDVTVEFELNKQKSAVEITATVKTTGKTGVEMEALTAVAVSALTIYDMCKPVERGIKIQDIRLVRKSGGKSGTIVLE
jgi:cyclic pyranopterin phosphate synthase